MFGLVLKSEMEKRIAEKDAQLRQLRESTEADMRNMAERTRLALDACNNIEIFKKNNEGDSSRLKEQNRVMRDMLSDILDFTIRNFRNDFFMRHVMMQCCQGLGLEFQDKYKEANEGAATNDQARLKRHEVYGDAESAERGYATFARKYPKSTKKPCPTPFEWMYLDGDENDTRISGNAERDCKLVKDLIPSSEVAEAYLKGKSDNDGMATGYYHQASELLFAQLTEQLRQSVHDAADLVASKNRG